jgi:hypothetical protein
MHSETRQRTGFLVVSSQIKDEERKKKKKTLSSLYFLIICLGAIIFLFTFSQNPKLNLLFFTPEDVNFFQLHDCPHAIIQSQLRSSLNLLLTFVSHSFFR